MASAKHFHIDEVAPAVWAEFLSNAVGATIFSDADWVQDAALASGGTPRLLGAWDGDHLVAGVAGVYRRTADRTQPQKGHRAPGGTLG
ncbi:MAG TPA: hypothetical protein EYQ31_09495 [Candidatus Handelsmanbacteria bacterium]|nr:hypothetical protein [Candidatus Handelsmanbacteria bacterium]